MPDLAPVADASARNAVLVYDGDCGFCTSSAAWIRARLREPADVVSWQSIGEAGLAQLGLSMADATIAAWWVDGARTLRRERAVAAALRASGFGWRIIGAAIAVPPVRWVAALGYRLVARYRHRLPGSTGACRISS